MSFGGTAEVNGTYAEQSGLRDGLPYLRHEQQPGHELRCDGGYWRLGDTVTAGSDASNVTLYNRAVPYTGYYRQRFDPSSPLPKQNGWEIDDASTLCNRGALPVPHVRPSWEHELLFEGDVYRQEDGPGPGGRGRFRCTVNRGLDPLWGGRFEDWTG